MGHFSSVHEPRALTAASRALIGLTNMFDVRKMFACSTKQTHTHRQHFLVGSRARSALATLWNACAIARTQCSHLNHSRRTRTHANVYFLFVLFDFLFRKRENACSAQCSYIPTQFFFLLAAVVFVLLFLFSFIFCRRFSFSLSACTLHSVTHDFIISHILTTEQQRIERDAEEEEKKLFIS